MEKKTFDGKCKSCKKQMEEVKDECPKNERGIYITYHCSYCGTYAYYYDNDEEPSEWIVPKIVEEYNSMIKKEKCKTCDDVKVITDGKPCFYNCELGGDCSDIPDWTKDKCKTCGKTVPCPECMPVANRYYLLWIRDNTNMNLAHRKIEKLEERIKEKDDALKGFLEIQQWCGSYANKNYGRYQTAIDERMAIAKDVVTEKISHAAIMRNDGILEIDKSHPIIIKRCPFGTCKAGSKMGFVTSTGRYVDRKEALKIALEAGQVNKDMDTIRQSGLISENIWADTDHEYDSEKGYYIPEDQK